MATGGMGFGTFHHGLVRNQLISMRVVIPDGTVKELKAEDPEIGNFLSTEGQMGIIVKATLKVGKSLPSGFPFVIPFEKVRRGLCLSHKRSPHTLSFRPDDLVVYHSELIRVLKTQSKERCRVGDENLVLAVFSEEDQAEKFRAYLGENRMVPWRRGSGKTPLGRAVPSHVHQEPRAFPAGGGGPPSHRSGGLLLTKRSTNGEKNWGSPFTRPPIWSIRNMSSSWP